MRQRNSTTICKARRVTPPLRGSPASRQSVREKECPSADLSASSVSTEEARQQPRASGVRAERGDDTCKKQAGAERKAGRNFTHHSIEGATP